MDLDDLIISVFCLIDESLPLVTGGQRLRQRGPQPILHDSEVLTMEVVGVYLGLTRDQALFAYFRRHWAHFVPALPHPSHHLCPPSGQSVGAQGASVATAAHPAAP